MTNVDRTGVLEQIMHRLDRADRLCSDLWIEIMAGAAGRFAAMAGQPSISRLNKFAADGAWVDAALALIEVELPAWRPRRIIFDDGEWYCALSRAPYLPEWLDQTVEALHRDLALALVKVAIKAMRETRSCEALETRSVPPISSEPRQYFCCDNYL